MIRNKISRFRLFKSIIQLVYTSGLLWQTHQFIKIIFNVSVLNLVQNDTKPKKLSHPQSITRCNVVIECLKLIS